MRIVVFDIETDGLRDEVSLMHCFCASVFQDNKFLYEVVLLNFEDVRNFLATEQSLGSILVGHNIKLYDLPVLKDLSNISFTGPIMDTLAISWYLYPDQKEHGLEYYGNVFKVPKPFIKDWKNPDLNEIINRCKTDVVINSILFGELYSYGLDIYRPYLPDNAFYYVTWKLDCAEEQYSNPLTINLTKVSSVLGEVEKLIEGKKAELASAMPEIVKYKSVYPPKNPTKKDGTISVAGEKWLQLLFEHNLPSNYVGEIKVIKERKPPNPGSVPQIKDWLFSLGWEPTIYKHEVNHETGAVRAIPQLQDADKNLCNNIIVLAEVHEELEALKGLFMLQHRKGILKGMLERADENGKLPAEVAGFTNTLRFKHKKPIVNLPSVERPYGKEIRGAIIAPNSDYLFCGSDMSSLEDSTKQHYMMYYDPEYVQAMRVPGFDPHIDIAKLANLITEDDERFFKWANKAEHLEGDDLFRMAKLKKARKLGKIVNFSGIYGAGPPKIALTTGMELDLAKQLHTTYWSRNKAVKQIAKDAQYKSVRGQLWLWNPVANMWYYLKKTKDIFSTLNQGKLCSE